MVFTQSGRMPSNMNQHFDRIPAAVLQRSQFRSPYRYTSAFNSGYIIPFGAFEVLPGDTFNDQFQIFIRMQSLIKPVMDNLWVDTHYFYVPNRLLWTHWENFIANEQNNPSDVNSYIMPISTSPAGGYPIGSLQDYLGLGTVGQIAGGATFQHNTLHLRAYNFIWNEFYRDQNLQNSLTVDTGDGPDTTANYVLKRRNKRFDYFTGCLPWPQKGAAVGFNLTGSADVWGAASALPSALGNNNAAPIMATFLDRNTTDGAAQYSMGANLGTAAFIANSSVATATGVGYRGGTAAGAGNIAVDNASDMVFLNKALSQAYRATATAPMQADLSTATAITINAFRQAFQIQMLLEKDARGGTRYVESLWSHFGVISPDFRLQRPEYLGGSTSPVSITPVTQTASTDATSPQGNLAAFGTVSQHRDGYVKSFVEHGVILCLLSVRADLTYQQGLHRMWSRSTRYDFYWPAFANLGEQPVYNREIYLRGDANDALVFGYQEPWAPYRYQPSLITGIFRSTAAGTLNIWHLAQNFTSLPTLGDTFIQENPPVSRIVAVTTEPEFFLDVFGDLRRSRVMPVYSVPGLITRL